ncbi:MAG: prepilin-type N-terminal cleavage/methylation domain-containing protein [Rhodanobacteraceae bacterium]|jgi:type IV fimbrial biogenesis protein FimT|nr:prepilin-type N-terminal cleavage/methylation domain-containing protein [Rhodanobacteraceae bacterium]
MSVARRRSKEAALTRNAGFGLIELVVTISIVAILAAIAFPSFAYVLRSNRVSAAANDLLSAFNLARNEAITRSRGVTICAADTRSGVPDACGTAGDWKHGWIVFVDDKVSGDPDSPIPSANILRSWVGNERNSLAPASDVAFIRFKARGEAQLTGDMTLTLKPSDACTNKQQRTILVTPLGRSSSTAVDCE